VKALPALNPSTESIVEGAKDAPEGDDTGLRWGVAGLVSCLPLVGWIAWWGRHFNIVRHGIYTRCERSFLK
jgi:hypothetical protein